MTWPTAIEIVLLVWVAFCIPWLLWQRRRWRRHDEAELALWIALAAVTRNIVSLAVALHLEIPFDFSPLAARFPHTQPGIGIELVVWRHPGHCPDCGSRQLSLGPRGGMAVNRACLDCGSLWNTVWSRLPWWQGLRFEGLHPHYDRDPLALIQRLG